MGFAPGGRLSIVTRSATSCSLMLSISLSIAFFHWLASAERMASCTAHGREIREIDPSQPVLYENTVGAYQHFFGVFPPADSWPSPPVVESGAFDGQEGHAADADISGRRRTFVRSTEEKFDLTGAGGAPPAAPGGPPLPQPQAGLLQGGHAYPLNPLQQLYGGVGSAYHNYATPPQLPPDNYGVYTIDLSQHKQREDIVAKVSRNMGVTARNFGTPVFQGPPVTPPDILNFRQDPSLFRDQVERAFQMVGRGVVKLEKDVPTAAGAGNVMKPWPDSRTSLRFDIIHNMLPPTMALLVVFPRAQFDKEKGASIHVARGVQWWTPGIAPKLKLVNHYTSSKSIDQGIEVATAYATNCDDVERMLLWKERPPAPPPAPPPPPTTSPPQERWE
eukprot:g15230.t1